MGEGTDWKRERHKRDLRVRLVGGDTLHVIVPCKQKENSKGEHNKRDRHDKIKEKIKMLYKNLDLKDKGTHYSHP